MNFIKQILAEAKNMLRSKFLLISAILIFAFMTVGVHALSYINDNFLQGGINSIIYGAMYSSYNNSIELDGVEYDMNNDIAWDLSSFYDMQTYITDSGLSSDAVKLGQELIDVLVGKYEFYLPLVKQAEPSDYDYYYNNRDYRLRFSYENKTNIINLFLLEKLGDGEITDEDAAFYKETMLEIENWYYIGYNQTEFEAYLEMTASERAEEISKLQLNVDEFDDLMENDDFSKYVSMSIRSYEDDIEQSLERIETLEEDIVKNPSQEEFINDEIESLLRNNQSILEYQIPELEYRLENNIVISDGSWQDNALNSKSSANSNILYWQSNLDLTEEEFYEDEWQVREYGTYQAFLDSLTKQIQEAQLDVLVADNSLDSGNPDMDFVPEGSRNQLYAKYSMLSLIMIFAVLLGGWCIANEFQSGAIRLLMIRPRTRIKVLFAKFLGGLVYIFVLYFAIMLVSIVVEGVIYGFGDYAFSNYTASGATSFFVMFFGHLLAGFSSVIFMYSFAFAASTIVRNMAVSVIIPMLAFIGSTILLPFLTMGEPIDILAFTPLPYVFINEFFTMQEYSTVSQLIVKGMPISLGLGIGMLLVYSAILIAIAAIIFKKKDINN